MASAYQHMGVPACLARDSSPTACQDLSTAFQRRFSTVTKHVSFSFAADPAASTRADYFITATASIPKDVMRACFGGTLNPPSPGSLRAEHVQGRFGQHGVFVSVAYQPTNRFWLFQGIQSAVFLGPAADLLALTVWSIRNRAT